MSTLRRRLMMNQYKKGEINYPGLIAAWSAKGKANDDEDRAILRDLSGHGMDLELKNFMWKQMSGYNGYDYAVQLGYNDGALKHTREDSYIHITEVMQPNWNQIYTESVNLKVRRAVVVKISGLSELKSAALLFRCFTGGEWKQIYVRKDGECSLPQCDSDPPEGTSNFRIDVREYEGKCNIKIEFPPLYPDALVFDGVDDMHVPLPFSEKTGIRKGYTVLANLVPLTSSYKDRGAFVCAMSPNPNADYGRMFECKGLGKPSIIAYTDNLPLSKKILGGTEDIYMSANNIGNSNILFSIIGTASGGGMSYLASVAFYSAYIFNRILTQDEVASFIKKHIDPNYTLPQI